MINTLYNKLRNIISIDYTGKQVNKILEFINDNNFIFHKIENFNNNGLEEVKFNRNNNIINIPRNFSILKENKEIFEEANKYYNNNTLNIFVSHEIGHSIHYSFLIKKEKNINNNWSIIEYGDICLSEINKSNLNIVNAQNFFKINNNKSIGIERFIQRNFVESYADCYSGLITYLMTNNNNVFDQMKDFREYNQKEIKNKKDVWIEYNQILNGKFATTEYSNIYGIEKFKDNFINNIEKEDILNIAGSNFEAIHHIIQIEVLDGLYKTMKKEAKTNDLLLLELKDFCEKKHGLTINKFFEEFSKHINNVREIYCVYTPTNILDNGAPFFDYDKAYLKISKENIIKEYKGSLSSKDLIKFNEAGITNLILNQFVYSYGISNYNSPINLNNKKITSENILNLKNKFTEQKIHNKNSFDLK